MTKLQNSKLDGTLTTPSRQTVATYLTKLLEDSARPTINDTTHANYQGVIDNHIIPAIGGIILTKLSPAQVQGLYSSMERNKRSAYTIRLAHAVLRLALKRAPSGI